MSTRDTFAALFSNLIANRAIASNFRDKRADILTCVRCAFSLCEKVVNLDRELATGEQNETGIKIKTTSTATMTTTMRDGWRGKNARTRFLV